jgi:hypothetical protein
LREREALAALGLDFRAGTTATGLDAARRKVVLDGDQPLDYDVLIIATGARARPSPVAAAADNVWPLRTSADAGRIRRAVKSGAHLAVLGAGFIGCEVAASAREAGCPVTLVDMQPAPLGRVLGVEPGKEIAARHVAAGVDVRCGVTIVSVDTDGAGAVSAITLSDGTTVSIDGLVVGLDEVPYFWSDQYGTKIQCVGEPSASAEITRVLTGPEGDRAMYLYSRAGRLVGALGFGLARAVMRLRPLVAEGVTVDDARHALAQLHPVASST